MYSLQSEDGVLPFWCRETSDFFMNNLLLLFHYANYEKLDK